MLFQSSKLKASTSLFTETWQKRRSSFELSKMSPQVGLAVHAILKSQLTTQCAWTWQCHSQASAHYLICKLSKMSSELTFFLSCTCMSQKTAHYFICITMTMSFSKVSSLLNLHEHDDVILKSQLTTQFAMFMTMELIFWFSVALYYNASLFSVSFFNFTKYLRKSFEVTLATSFDM